MGGAAIGSPTRIIPAEPNVYNNSDKTVVKSDSQETYDLMTLFRESFTAPVALGRATDWPGGIRTR